MNKEIATKLKSLGKFKHISFLRPINKGIDNKNYLLKADGRKYILKIYSLKNVEEVEYELEIIKKLRSISRFNNFPTTKSDIFNINGKPMVLFYYIEGKTLCTRDVNFSTIEKIAKIQAQMHKNLLNFFPVHKKFRFPIFDFSFVDYFKNILPSTNDAFLLSEINILRKEAYRFAGIKFRKTIIHEDLNLDNIVRNKNKQLVFIDFGDSHRAEIISDIATATKELIINVKGLDFTLVKKYLDSYQKILTLAKKDLEILPFLWRRRTIFMVTYLTHKQEKGANSAKLTKKILREINTLQKLRKNEQKINNFIKNYIWAKKQV